MLFHSIEAGGTLHREDAMLRNRTSKASFTRPEQEPQRSHWSRDHEVGSVTEEGSTYGFTPRRNKRFLARSH